MPADGSSFILTVKTSGEIVAIMDLSRASLVLGVGIAITMAGESAPDFQIIDQNPNSERYGSPVSPRLYLLQVSGYYFGSAG